MSSATPGIRMPRMPAGVTISTFRSKRCSRRSASSTNRNPIGRSNSITRSTSLTPVEEPRAKEPNNPILLTPYSRLSDAWCCCKRAMMSSRLAVPSSWLCRASDVCFFDRRLLLGRQSHSIISPSARFGGRGYKVPSLHQPRVSGASCAQRGRSRPRGRRRLVEMGGRAQRDRCDAMVSDPS